MPRDLKLIEITFWHCFASVYQTCHQVAPTRTKVLQMWSIQNINQHMVQQNPHYIAPFQSDCDTVNFCLHSQFTSQSISHKLSARAVVVFVILFISIKFQGFKTVGTPVTYRRQPACIPKNRKKKPAQTGRALACPVAVVWRTFMPKNSWQKCHNVYSSNETEKKLEFHKSHQQEVRKSKQWDVPEKGTVGWRGGSRTRCN